MRANLEHREHDISEEAYAKQRRKLSKDQQEAVKALLETNPSTRDLAQFLCELTGKEYSTKEAHYIKTRLTNEGVTNKCEQCGQTFSQTSHLKRHKNMVHSNL